MSNILNTWTILSLIFFFVIFESSPKTVDDLFPLSVVLFSDLSLFHLSRFFWAVQMIHFIIKWKISISDTYVVYKICATKQCVYLVKYFINNLHLSNASVSARFCINILSQYIVTLCRCSERLAGIAASWTIWYFGRSSQKLQEFPAELPPSLAIFLWPTRVSDHTRRVWEQPASHWLLQV